MFRKLLMASCLLLTSMTSQAALISYNGYERDSSSNIVSGGGLEWLMWDVTTGMSIDEALEKYASQGWKLATEANMTSLFNAFKFGKLDWNYNNNQQSHFESWTSDENSVHLDFISLFGRTSYVQVIPCNSNCSTAFDPQYWSSAIFGSEDVKTKLFSSAGVFDDATIFDVFSNLLKQDHWAGLSPNYTDRWTGDFQDGVALVRIAGTGVEPVPAPAPFSLLALTISILGLCRRKVFSR